jgi:large subunit ribosomal protein L15
MAGLHKHKWSWTVKYAPDHFGYKGFYRHPKPTTTEKWVNVGQLDHIYGRLRDEGKVEEKDGVPVINLALMGVEKLLGGGRVKNPYHVIVRSATEKAVRKIEEAGGKVEIVQGPVVS